MMQKGLLVGINDYPGTNQDLGGCVNDAKAWASLLTTHYAFPEANIRLLLDAQATKAAMLSGLDWLVEGARPGDVLVLAYSGHGTWVPDQGETDEQHGRDEALCPYDLGEDCSNLLVDDELRARFRQVPQGVHLAMISDSCHAGTVSRAIPGGVRPAHPRPWPRRCCAAHQIPATPGGLRARHSSPLPRHPPAGADEEAPGRQPESDAGDPPAGAASTQFSYDALISGKRHGAFTYYALRTIEAAHSQLTYLALIRGVLKRLLFNRYPQTPLLEGSRANKRGLLFTPAAS